MKVMAKENIIYMFIDKIFSTPILDFALIYIRAVCKWRRELTRTFSIYF
jgi:hypothetical protein